MKNISSPTFIATILIVSIVVLLTILIVRALGRPIASNDSYIPIESNKFIELERKINDLETLCKKGGGE